MVVIEIQVHAGRQAPGLKPKKVPAGRKGDAISTPGLAWSPREGALGCPIPRCFLCPRSHTHRSYVPGFCPLCFVCVFPCFRLGAPWRQGLSLSDWPPRRALHTGGLQNVRRRSHLQSGSASGDAAVAAWRRLRRAKAV